MSANRMSPRLPVCLFFVAFLCGHRQYSNGVFASPIAGLASAGDQNTTNPEIAGLQTQSEQHYMQSMITELLTKVLIDPFKRIVVAMALYLEILSEASGARTLTITNASSEANEADDKRQQLIAIASTNLWLNLTLMERMNEIFLNASYAVTPVVEEIKTEALPSIIADMFEKIDGALTRSDSLGPLYTEEKLKAEKLTVPVLASGTGNPDTTYELYPRFRAFIVRRQALEYLSGHVNVNDTVKFPRHVLSHTLFKLVKDASASQQVQQIFDEAVQTTLDKIDPTARNEDLSGAIDKILFAVLDEKLKVKWAAQLAEVRAQLVKKYGRWTR